MGECLAGEYFEDREKQGVLRLRTVILALFIPSVFENRAGDFLVYPYSIDKSFIYYFSLLTRLLAMSCLFF